MNTCNVTMVMAMVGCKFSLSCTLYIVTNCLRAFVVVCKHVPLPDARFSVQEMLQSHSMFTFLFIQLHICMA